MLEKIATAVRGFMDIVSQTSRGLVALDMKLNAVNTELHTIQTQLQAVNKNVRATQEDLRRLLGGEQAAGALDVTGTGFRMPFSQPQKRGE